VSFGPKLDPLPLTCSPNEDIVVTMQFVPGDEAFERVLTIYVEELSRIRPIKITVKSHSLEARP
jgi:hypothetical protein